MNNATAGKEGERPVLLVVALEGRRNAGPVLAAIGEAVDDGHVAGTAPGAVWGLVSADVDLIARAPTSGGLVLGGLMLEHQPDDDRDEGAAFAAAGFDMLGSVSRKEARELGQASGADLLHERPDATDAKVDRLREFLRGFLEALGPAMN